MGIFVSAIMPPAFTSLLGLGRVIWMEGGSEHAA